MKICWDNLEGIKYNKKSGLFRLNGKTLHYHESCVKCGDPHLSGKNRVHCNLTCAVRGRKFSDETKKKMSEAKGEVSEETRQKMSKARKGKPSPMKGRNHSDEAKKKMSESHTGEKLSEEHKKKIGESRRGEDNPMWNGGYAAKKIPTYDVYAPQLEPYEECRRNEKDLNVLEVKCTYCGKWHTPTIGGVCGRINGIDSNDTSRFYCSPGCKQECPIYWRQKSHKGQKNKNSREVQPQLRQLVFERDNWTCQKCGSTKSLHCHHIDPVKSNPIESADIDNSITLCKDCHKWVHKNIPGCGYRELADLDCIDQ